jgi:signal transduction histidine kinase
MTGIVWRRRVFGCLVAGFLFSAGSPSGAHEPAPLATSADAPSPDGDALVAGRTAWEQYGRGLLAIAAVGLLQAAIIVLLLIERQRRQKHFVAWQIAEREAQASEALNRGVLALWPHPVAIVSPDGVVLRVNAAWAEARRVRIGPLADVEVGTNLLAHLDAACGAHDAAAPVQRALQSVLLGRSDDARLDYRAERDHDEAWSEVRVFPLDAAERGAVLSIADATERRRADLEAERRLQEIAHSSRAAALGELAASLAHELNQPMTAILSNAQAARNFLTAGSPSDLDEVRLALDDIVSDDRRAGEIIRRMRTLLKKDEVSRSVFDLNERVADVARLATSAALLRHVTLRLDLAPQLPPMHGDAVQIQQVALNLVMNGIEASASLPAGPRIVRIETAVLDGEMHVAVTDSGPGIAAGAAQRIFEPFFTTKPEGLGMGLAISRSIVSAHAGRIWADTSSDGATFHVVLPMCVDDVDVPVSGRHVAVTGPPDIGVRDPVPARPAVQPRAKPSGVRRRVS